MERRMFLPVMTLGMIAAAIEEPARAEGRKGWPLIIPAAENVLPRKVAEAQADKDGRILVEGFRVADTAAGNGTLPGLTLIAPRAVRRAVEDNSDPTLWDGVEVALTPEVLGKLADLGIEDAGAHFLGRTLRVRGTRKTALYTGFPAYEMHTVTVDRIEDLKVTDRGGGGRTGR